MNSSYDLNPLLPGEVVWPEDGSYARAVSVHRCNLAQVVDALWREGRVPEWINVTAVDTARTSTVIAVVSCGRFTDDQALLYHQREGLAPFHVVGPWLPPNYSGAPYSIHQHAECWDDDDDLVNLHAVQENVWSLELYTNAFDRDNLRELPDLPAMEILEHRRCSLIGNPFAMIARFPACAFSGCD